MITRIVRMTFKEEHVDAFLELFNNNSAKIAEMRGCSHLQLMKDSAAQNIFYTLSTWDNEEDLNDYRKSKTFDIIWGECKKYFSDKPQAFSLLPYITVKE